MNERVSEQKDVTDIVKDFHACNKHYLLLDTTIKRTFLLKFLLLALAYIVLLDIELKKVVFILHHSHTQSPSTTTQHTFH